MTEGGGILVFGCDDAATDVMTSCLAARGVDLVAADSQADLVRRVAAHPPLAVVVGVDTSSVGELEVIEMLHAISRVLPVVVIASEDSIEIERRARQAGIFYYVVEPLQREEIEAVMDDLLRYAAEG